MTADPPAATQRWLATQWEFLHGELPSPPARVVDVGCGPYGGFVPELRRQGYEAVGVDPVAPVEDGYVVGVVEDYATPELADAVIACTSLHHTADLNRVLDGIAGMLKPDGVLAVIEWDWVAFDEDTARWCFERLDPVDTDTWLHHHHEHWVESGRPWAEYLATQLTAEGLHSGADILTALGQRFDLRHCSIGPYFHPDLLDVTRADEQQAIDVARIQATGIRAVGTPRPRRRPPEGR